MMTCIMYLAAKTETTGGGLEKVKNSAYPDILVTKFHCGLIKKKK